jgi:hypothetical protein
MAIRYKEFDGKKVSIAWYRVLKRMRKHGVPFRVNSGHRTLREQAALFRQNMQFVGGRWVPKPGRPLTAFPSPFAPHIRLGRADHAIDFGTTPSMVDRVQRYLNSRGLKARETVAGEWWHVEVDRGRLVNLARRILRDERRR